VAVARFWRAKGGRTTLSSVWAMLWVEVRTIMRISVRLKMVS
jgi:hypothetical protein